MADGRHCEYDTPISTIQTADPFNTIMLHRGAGGEQT